MWTSRNRARYDRSKLRYPSDVTDEEWELIVRLIPPGKSGGGKRTVIMREVVNGLMYVLSTGCQWRAIPTDLPPKSTVYDYFDLWTYDRTLQRIHHALYEQCREQAPGSPDESGKKRREKGLARSGNARVRRGMIQLAWRFLMFQKGSALAHWFYARTKNAPQTRKTMIVALARKLLIALWRLAREGAIPEGIVLRPAL